MPAVAINDMGKGVNKDVMPEELVPGASSDCMNVRVNNGFAERCRGMQELFPTPPVVPYWVAPYGTNVGRYWIWFGTQRAFADDGVTRTEITNATPFTGAVDNRWTGGTLNGVFLANNGVDQPQYWSGKLTDKLLVQPGWNAAHRAGWMRPWKNQIWCGDITKGVGTTPVRDPHMLKGSWAAVPGAVPSGWDPEDPTQDGIERDLAETSDFQVDALPLGDSLIVYKERSAYAVSQSFDTRIIASRKIIGHAGMMARGCAVQIPMGHVVLTAGDVVIHNGQEVQSIVSGVMRKWLFNLMDSQNFSRSFLTVNPQRNEVWICFPTSGSPACDMALIYNWASKGFGIRQLEQATFGDMGQVNGSSAFLRWDDRNVSWESDATTWDENEYAANEARTVFSHLKPRISICDVGTSDFGAGYVSRMERTGLSFSDTDSMKVIRNTRFRFDAAAGTQLTIQVGTHKNPAEPPTWAAPGVYTVGANGRIEVNALTVAGRFLAYRISSGGPQLWRLRSFDLDFVQTGRY